MNAQDPRHPAPGGAPPPDSQAPASTQAPPGDAFEPVPDPVPDAAPLPPGATAVPCARIGEVLFAYMARELGPAQSLLVREHLRRCPSCRGQALAYRRTLDLLRERDPAADAPRELSPRRWKRVLWTLSHPVLDFVFVHHRAASLAVAILAVLLVACWLFTRVTGAPPFRVFWITLPGANVTIP